MLLIPGPPALSDFRIAKLLQRLKALDAAVQGLAARFVHFADLAAPLSAAQHSIIEQLPGPSRRGRARQPTLRTCAALRWCGGWNEASSTG